MIYCYMMVSHLAITASEKNKRLCRSYVNWQRHVIVCKQPCAIIHSISFADYVCLRPFFNTFTISRSGKKPSSMEF